MFTDLVGSTVLKQQLGDTAGTALIQQHHALAREIMRPLADDEGTSTVGDAFLIRFATGRFIREVGLRRACPAGGVSRPDGSPICPARPIFGVELGAAIRRVVTRLHRLAPSLEGHPVEVIETRLKEQEDEVLKQLHTIDERLREWQRASSD